MQWMWEQYKKKNGTRITALSKLHPQKPTDETDDNENS